MNGPIQFNMDLSTSFNRNISTMTSNASAFMLQIEKENKSCDFTSCLLKYDCWKYGVHLSILILLLIALLFTVIIILNKVFHSASPWNNIFIFLTMIIWIIGVGLLYRYGDWYEPITAASMSSVLAIFAMLFGIKLQDSARKWRILLFFSCCLFLAAGIAFFALAIKYRFQNKIQFAILSFICFCAAMFIVSYSHI
ncbi:unnamed protein product [Schistosoma turkestanicum]|nr:unnamed protein product [Schistosoma turkestanicum]